MKNTNIEVQEALVSIVIPCYNNEHFVGDAIESALSQSYSHTQVIAIDDGSSDCSLEIIRSYGDLIQWEKQPNQGAPVARNRGLQLSTGKYVKFLDADDVLLPDSIATQIQQTTAIEATHKAIVYGEAVWVDQHLQPTQQHPLRPRRTEEEIVAHILTACPLTSCPLHRRDYLLEIGGFDVTLPRGQEHDLHLRLALSGVEFIYHPDVVYQYRNYGGSDRISAHDLGEKDVLVHYRILKKQQALIETQSQQPTAVSIRQAMAQRYWQFGRGVLREGYTTAAQKYFQAAQALSPRRCMFGNAPYPLLARWLGPYRAEALLTSIKQFQFRAAR